MADRDQQKSHINVSYRAVQRQSAALDMGFGVEFMAPEPPVYRKLAIQKSLEGDFSDPGGANYFLYREGLLEGKAAFFNSAGIPNQFPGVYAAANRFFCFEDPNPVQRIELPPGELNNLLENGYNQARKSALGMVGATEGKYRVALLNSGSDAVGFALRLAGPAWGSDPITDPDSGYRIALITDTEYPGIRQDLTIRRMIGVPSDEDIGARPNFGASLYKRRNVPEPKAQAIELFILGVAERSTLKILDQLGKIPSRSTPTLAFISHVDRNTGRELPIQEICQKLRTLCPNVFIIVDGAQALGNVRKIDISSIGCDAYTACTQKALGGEVGGLLFYDPENPRIQAGLQWLSTVGPDQQIIRRGMFAEIPANVDEHQCGADLVGFIEAIKFLESMGLEGNDFSKIDDKRGALRNYFLSRLKEVSDQTGLKLILPEIDSPTNFIQSFRFEGMQRALNIMGSNLPEEIIHRLYRVPHFMDDGNARNTHGYRIAEKLLKRNVFISYLAAFNMFRVSFHPHQTNAEVDRFIDALTEVLWDPEIGLVPDRVPDVFD